MAPLDPLDDELEPDVSELEGIESLAQGAQGAIANMNIGLGTERAHFVYRARPDNAFDSGWRVFTGAETDDEMEDPDTFAVYGLAVLIGHDASLTPLFTEPTGTAFERKPGAEWKLVHDFVLEDE